jgi:hypothetical protein
MKKVKIIYINEVVFVKIVWYFVKTVLYFTKTVQIMKESNSITV